jgi:hypothetical protein
LVVVQSATWTDERLDDFARSVDRRFEQVDQRFEQVDRRFEQMDRRFDRVDDSLRHLTAMMMWAAGGIIATLVGVIAAVAINGGA